METGAKRRYVTTTGPNLPEETYVRPDESRRDAFKRVATRKLDLAVNSLRQIGIMGRGGNYEFHPDDVQRVREVLQKELDEAIVNLGGKIPGYFN